MVITPTKLLKWSFPGYAKRRIQNLPPIFQALLVQLSAIVIYALLFPLLGVALAENVSPVVGAFVLGGFALVLSFLLNFERWWHLINFLLTPALILTLYLPIPPVYFLLAFVGMVAVFWSTYRTQVPLYLSSHHAFQAISLLLPEHLNFRLIDLGSGLGGLLAHVKKVRSDGVYHGIENAPLPILISWLRFLFVKNISVSWGSLWRCNLADYDVVYAYLSPVPMAALWDKAKSEMRPGTLLISNTFDIPGIVPSQVIEIEDFNHSVLYLWRM